MWHLAWRFLREVCPIPAQPAGRLVYQLLGACLFPIFLQEYKFHEAEISSLLLFTVFPTLRPAPTQQTTQTHNYLLPN